MKNNNHVSEDSITRVKRRGIIGIVTSAIIMCGAGFGIGFGVGVNSKGSNELSSDMKTFLNYYNFFKDNYYIEQDERTLIDGLYYGLTSSVNDNYTFYVSSKNNETQGLSTTQVGIGFERTLYKGNALLTYVMKNSPASRAKFIDENGEYTNEVGLKKGDIITKVKEVDVVGDYYVLKDNSYADWGNHISGDLGSSVEIVIERDGVEKRCIAVRGTFDTDKVRLIEKNYSASYKEAVVKVESFLGTTSSNESTPAREMIDLFKNDLFKNNNTIDNLIIDLRGNGGGYVNNCSELLSLFVGKKQYYGYHYYPRKDQYQGIPLQGNLYSYGGWKNYNENIKHYTLIVDENSASATESFALGMRDFDETHNKTRIVGETSFGKGIAQSFIYPYSNDLQSSIRYTYAQVVSIKKNSINQRGIVPDIMVEPVCRSIQNGDEYDFYRKEVKNAQDVKDQAIIKARIEVLLDKTYSSLEESIRAYQIANGMDIDGIYSEELASVLNNKFWSYYQSHRPVNLFSVFIEGRDDIDSFSPNEKKYIKKQIEEVMQESFDNFSLACSSFQSAYSSEFSKTPSAIYDLETSYILQSKIYKIRESYKNRFIEVAK